VGDEMKAGIELDRLVAEHVMGWEYKWDGWITNYNIWISDFSPSTDMSDAWLVVEKIKGEDHFVNLYNTITKEWYCKVETTDKKKFAYAETAPLAIVKASLKAKGVEIE
jgi:hypothetical protein